jgi:DNA-binding transcriptional MerR regulator
MGDPLLTLREYAKLAPWNIRDLATLSGGILDASGVTPINAAAQSRPSDRTIRFYVTRRLMSAPDGRGTAATYGYRHLLQLLAIKVRQMEGATLSAIARELAESPGDVLEKRVAATLGDFPAPEQLDLDPSVAPRGRVARAIARRSHVAGDGPASARTAPVAPPPPLEEGGWYRIGVGDGVEVAVRADHPVARSAAARRHLADALARALRETPQEGES